MIYRCLPERISRIWGSLPPQREGAEPTGEIWWFSDETVLAGESGVERRAGEFFPGNSVPLVVKTLHAAKNLSVQVHPGHDGTKPVKDESWVVLGGRGEILHGTVDGTTPEQFREAVQRGSVADILQVIQAEPGLVVHLPAGTVHALGAGLTVLEVQLNCDVTYRLWDYARTDINGNFRELHTEKGLEAVNWKNMGRASVVSGDYLDAGTYFIRKSEPGFVQLRPLELVYVPLENRCYFADVEGGTVSTAHDSWILGMTDE
jgi:mannose-6-phosphate isomerase class I